MIKTPDGVKRYNAAKHRFLRPILIKFFAREFPKFFGPIMRERIVDELIDLFEKTAPETRRIKPGQILWNALDIKTRGDSPNRRYVPVVLSVVNENDIEQLANDIPMSVVANKAIARMMKEAYEQGGVLSGRDIGLLTLRTPSYVSRKRLEYEKEYQCLLPHTGLLHDMGSCISHKKTIIKKVMIEKKDPADVARECHHTQRAVDRYLKDFHRVKTAYKQNQNMDYVHIVTGISKNVVKQYIEMIDHAEF
jgi:hypothetical protein